MFGVSYHCKSGPDKNRDYTVFISYINQINCKYIYICMYAVYTATSDVFTPNNLPIYDRRPGPADHRACTPARRSHFIFHLRQFTRIASLVTIECVDSG